MIILKIIDKNVSKNVEVNVACKPKRLLYCRQGGETGHRL